MDLQEAFDAGFEAVKAYVDGALGALEERLAALEAREPLKGEKGDAGEPGRDGVDGAPGKDGIDGKDGADGAPGRDGEKGADGKDGADGVGLADAVIDREGQLILTMTNGQTKALGVVIGKDGAPGKDGEKGLDGTNGRDGIDGVGFDDLDLVETDEGLSLRAVRGEVVKEWALPVVFYRGVFSADANYRKGNSVTWGGSLWIAEKDAPEGKPDTPESGWRLAVKKGQNGKDLTK